MKNKFIVIEGMDGIGKDTMIEYLKTQYPDVYFTREPGGTEVGEEIRNILLHKNKNPLTEALLFAAARSEFAEHIKNILNDKHVISSRYLYSSIYQKLLLPNKRGDIELINYFAVNSLYPQVVIFCYLDDENILLDRLNKSDRQKDIIESRGLEYFKKINDYYKHYEAYNDEIVIKLEVSSSIKENNEKIKKIIKEYLG